MSANEQSSKDQSQSTAATPAGAGTNAHSAPPRPRKAELPPLPPVDYLAPRQPPVLEIAFRRDESSDGESPRRQMIGFATGLFGAILVGIALYSFL